MADNETAILAGRPEHVPREVVESILREHLAEDTAALTTLDVEPFPNVGSSGNNTHYRVRLAWQAERSGSVGADEWIVKCWRPGGLSERLLGLNKPLEALAWQHGLVRPHNLPPGVITPFVGARIDAEMTRAWVAMADVSEELDHYSRGHPLSDDQLLHRVRLVLERLARLHVWWERPEQGSKLAECDWLVDLESMLWRYAATWAVALGREPMAPFEASEVTATTRARVQAFLEWFRPTDRAWWKELLIDRRHLILAFQGVPRTLLHGDTDDRNLGLRWPPGTSVDGTADSGVELVLIDWEWPCLGPAALDVSYVVMYAAMLSDPSRQSPAFYRSDELPDYYFDCYGALGGKRLDRETWRRSLDLAWLAWAATWAPSVAGRLLLTLQGQAPVPRFPGLPEEVMLHRMQKMWQDAEHVLDRATHAARRWLV